MTDSKHFSLDIRQGSKPLSVIGLRNICLFIAVLVFINALVDYLTVGDQFPTFLTIGRMLACLGLLAAALCAHVGRPRVAFLLFSVVQVFSIYNASVIAGFGAYSPALLFVLPIIILAVGIFGYPHGLIWALPVALAWMVVSGLQIYPQIAAAISGSAWMPSSTFFGQLTVPSPVAWLSTQFIVGAVVVAIVRLYERQNAELLSEERKRHADTLTDLAIKEKVSIEREKFMGHLAHELRTPLAAMRNAMTLANHPKASDAMRQKALQTLDGAIANLQNLLNDALDSFKYGQTDFAIQQTEFSVSQFLTSIETLYSGMAQSRGLEFVLETDAPAGQMLIGDSMRLGQMLSNLISNAIKFTHTGGVAVRVMLSDTQRGVWRFEVRDTGPGISRADQERLFKPFIQLNDGQRPDSQSIKGSGLGLSIVARLAQAMGGSVGLDSAPGEGSAFYFEVPLRSVVSSPATLKSV